MPNRTGFLWHEAFAWHDAGTYSAPYVEPISVADSPDTKRRFRNLIEMSGLLDELVPVPFRAARDDEILRAHSESHLDALKRIDKTGGEAGPFAHMGRDGLKIVRLASGAAIAAVDAVLDGHVQNAYALVRPAGHHAGRDSARGFCLLNNVAMATLHAIEVRGLERVAIVDWDVHHGNGTQEIFWADPRVLAISIHEDGLFALGGGAVEERGEGEGLGTTINVPLPSGGGEGAYLAAMREVVLPALDRFEPSLIIIASGLDALAHDSLGRMMLHSDSYRSMTAMLMQAAERLCGARLALVHEGGYSATVVPFAGLAILETLCGFKTGVVDPFMANVQRRPGQALLAHQQQAVTRAAAAALQAWNERLATRNGASTLPRTKA
jgi:acetoin utilization deacetylase AcuC-like enzyme